jgi:hypothetical protein
MSRMAAGETINVKPKSNVFTWMAGVSVALQLLALVMLFFKLQAE